MCETVPCKGKPCPHTVCKPCAFTGVRREQAPALRCSVYLFARRDAPPGASGKGLLGHNVAGKGKHSLPLVGEGAPQGRMRWRLPLAQCRTTAIRKLHLISLGLWPIQLPLVGEAFGCIPCPHTVCKPCAFTGFRREQAPALRCSVYLFARRDAPPGASGKGLLGHNVAGKGCRDDTPYGRTLFAPTVYGLPFCP